MKKSVKFLSLAAALLAGFGTTAHAESNEYGFKTGASVVTSYIWRGVQLSDAPAIQPYITYHCPITDLEFELLGSTGIGETTGTTETKRYTETDFTISRRFEDLKIFVTNYYVPKDGKSTLNFKSDGPNVIELGAAYTYEGASLQASVNVAGEETAKNATYLEAGYQIYDENHVTAKVFLGAGDSLIYGNGMNDGKTGFKVTNAGLTVAQDRFTGTAVYNFETQVGYFVLGASF